MSVFTYHSQKTKHACYTKILDGSIHPRRFRMKAYQNEYRHWEHDFSPRDTLISFILYRRPNHLTEHNTVTTIECSGRDRL